MHGGCSSKSPSIAGEKDYLLIPLVVIIKLITLSVGVIKREMYFIIFLISQSEFKLSYKYCLELQNLNFLRICRLKI